MKEKNIKKQKKEFGNIDSSLKYFLRLNLPRKIKILDVGCSYGSLIYNLYQSGYKDIFGLDIKEEYINEGKKVYKDIASRIQFYNGKKLPYGDETFDAVLMFDVIEHIPNIDEFLKEEVFRVLKKGGIFIFQTPNKYLNIIWVYIDNRSLKVKWWEEHCSLQTYFGLKKLLNRSGFNDLKIEKYNINTQHNRNKIQKKIGKFGILVLKIFEKLPIFLSSNLWGIAKK